MGSARIKERRGKTWAGLGDHLGEVGALGDHFGEVGALGDHFGEVGLLVSVVADLGADLGAVG